MKIWSSRFIVLRWPCRQAQGDVVFILVGPELAAFQCRRWPCAGTGRSWPCRARAAPRGCRSTWNWISGSAFSRSLSRSTSPGTVSMARMMSAANCSSSSKSSPDSSMETGAPVGGPSSSRSTLISAPGTVPIAVRMESITASELVWRSAASTNSMNTLPWWVAAVPPPPNGHGVLPPDRRQVELDVRIAAPASARSVRRTASVRSMLVPCGNLTCTVALRGSTSGNSSMPWPKRA